MGRAIASARTFRGARRSLNTTSISAQDFAAAVSDFSGALAQYQEEINGLNVYPVPDGDTGTNLRLTLDKVREELQSSEDVPRSIIQGSLRGARGNSGVILSQILRGVSEAIQESGGVSPRSLAAG